MGKQEDQEDNGVVEAKYLEVVRSGLVWDVIEVSVLSVVWMFLS